MPEARGDFHASFGRRFSRRTYAKRKTIGAYLLPCERDCKLFGIDFVSGIEYALTFYAVIQCV